jgi:hypothetical protein
MNFRVQSRTLQRSLFWKNVKIYVLFVLIGIVSKIHIFIKYYLSDIEIIQFFIKITFEH